MRNRSPRILHTPRVPTGVVAPKPRYLTHQQDALPLRCIRCTAIAHSSIHCVRMDSGYNRRGTMQRTAFIITVWLMLLCVAWPVQAQRQAPEFDVDVVSARAFDADALTQVDLYTRIPYASLQFINDVEGFTATYDVTVEARTLDEEGRRRNLRERQIWDAKVITPVYATTQDPGQFHFTTQAINLPPGRYALEFLIQDRATSEAFVHEVLTEIRDLSGPIAVSDLTLVDSYDEARKTIRPLVTGRVGTDQVAMQVFYELHAETPQTVRVTRTVVRALQGEEAAVPEGEDASGMTVYTLTEDVTLEPGANQVIADLPIRDFGVGAYLLQVDVADLEGNVLDQTRKTFETMWSGLAAHISNLDEAIDQMRVVAKPREMRHISEAANDTERLQRFLAFWKKRDPTPATQRNERMEEYYYRVAFANRQYGRSVNGQKNNGWMTDRGNVMVRFGPPDNIQRHPYSFNTEPYEVWYYYSIGLRFTFVDRTGLGDYELLIPIWDERNRIR